MVVDKSSNDETGDVLVRLCQQYPHLYTTFIPESSHYLSRTKLALTVGIKAAKYEWIIMTDADCEPQDEGWLNAIATHCDEGTDMVLGYTNYLEGEKHYLWRYERLQTSLYSLRRAQHRLPYRYNGQNLAFRKSLFTANNGFLNNLTYLRGEYDFVVNEYAQPGRVTVAVEPQAWNHQAIPSSRKWLNEHLFYMETRKHLRRSTSWRWLCNADTTGLHLALLTQLAGCIYGAVSQNWWILGAAVFAFVLAYILRAVTSSKTAKKFGERIPGMYMPWAEWRCSWQRIHCLLRHARADKYDFIRR